MAKGQGNFGKKNFLLEVYRILNKKKLMTPELDKIIDTIVREYERDELHDVFKTVYGGLRRTIDNTEEPYKQLKINEYLDNFKYYKENKDEKRTRRLKGKDTVESDDECLEV